MCRAIDQIKGNIIAKLETIDHTKWEKPWLELPDGFAVNEVSKKEYTGINRLILSSAMFDLQSNKFATYKQWQEKGRQVKKGSKGYPVVFFKQLTVEDKATEKEKTIPMLKTYTVFNESQLTDFEGTKEKINEGKLWGDYENVEKVRLHANVKHQAQNRACYRSQNDEIIMPVKGQFETASDYYATLLHELGHWTGHKTRLDRQIGNKFGNPAYAFEELVAEFTSAFCCAHFGVTDTPRPDHAMYIKGWLQVLKDESQALIKACALAEKAYQFIVGLESGKEQIAA